MRVERLNEDPEVLLIRDFITQAEADALIAAADARLERSTTVCDKPGGCVVEQRTSSSAPIPDDPGTRIIQARGRILGRLPFAEPLQVVRYEAGQEYEPHLDAFSASDEGGRRAIAQYGGRQREATILIYLQAPEEGGETVFPRLDLRVPATPLSAVYWRNIHSDGSIDERTLHGGAPVSKGTKYAANLWLRGRAADPIYALAASENVDPPTEPRRHGKSAAIIACGAGVGALIGGPPGALLGSAAGWAVDAIRRRHRA